MSKLWSSVLKCCHMFLLVTDCGTTALHSAMLMPVTVTGCTGYSAALHHVHACDGLHRATQVCSTMLRLMSGYVRL